MIVPFDLQTSASRSTVFMGNAILRACQDIHRQLRGEIIGNGTMRKTGMPEHPLGGEPAFYEFNCTAFELEVDTETGEILIHRHVTVGDVGKALNPLQVEMQDEGAAIMGLGHTLTEHIIVDDTGRIQNLGALDYRIPALAAAVTDATGVVIRDLPLTPERVWRHIREDNARREAP